MRTEKYYRNLIVIERMCVMLSAFGHYTIKRNCLVVLGHDTHKKTNLNNINKIRIVILIPYYHFIVYF